MTLTYKSIAQQILLLFFLISLLAVSLLPFWSFYGVCPNFMSALIYLWTIYRPDLRSSRLYIILGLVRDGLFGYPLGVSVFEILLLVSITNLLRRFVLGRSYEIVYLGYGIFSFLSHMLIWCILSWVKGTILPLEVVLKSTLLNLLVYPLMCQISIYMQKQVDALR